MNQNYTYLVGTIHACTAGNCVVYMSQACAFLNTCMHLVSLILQDHGFGTSELGETHFTYRLESVIYSQRLFKLFSPENTCNEVSDLLDCLQTN